MPSHHRGPPAEVRALDAFLKLTRCARSVSARLEARLRKVGLTENQFGVLEMLFHLGPLEQHQIAARLLTSEPNVSLIGSALEERGLIGRERSSEDRRRV